MSWFTAARLAAPPLVRWALPLFGGAVAAEKWLRDNGYNWAVDWIANNSDEIDKYYTQDELSDVLALPKDGDVRVTDDGITQVYNADLDKWQTDYTGSYNSGVASAIESQPTYSNAAKRIRKKLTPKPVEPITNANNIDIANSLPSQSHVQAHDIVNNSPVFDQIERPQQKAIIEKLNRDNVAFQNKLGLLNENAPTYSGGASLKSQPLVRKNFPTNTVYPGGATKTRTKLLNQPNTYSGGASRTRTKLAPRSSVYDRGTRYENYNNVVRVPPVATTTAVPRSGSRVDRSSQRIGRRTPPTVIDTTPIGAAGNTAAVTEVSNANQIDARNRIVGAESTTAQPNYPNNPPPGMMEAREYEANTKNSDVQVQTPDEQVENKKTESATSKNKKFKVNHPPPGENVLHEYVTYTYDARLSALPQEFYINDELKLASNTNIIIRSSGLGQQKAEAPKRSGKGKGPSRSQQRVKKAGGGADAVYSLAPGSQLNSHFGQITLNSIMGLNSHTNVSNVHGLTFEVFEPYATSLLDDLHDAQVAIGNDNYLQSPYLLTIDFHGMDDNGVPTKAITTRYFPIKIVNCDFNVTGAGTTYTFSAVPWNASTMNDNIKYTQDPVTIRGETVRELFDDLETQLNEQFAAKDENRKYFIRGGTSFDDMGGPSSWDILSATIGHDSTTALSTAYAPELTEEGKKYVQNLQAGLQSSESAQKQADAGKQYTASDLAGVDGNLTRRTYTFNKGVAITSIIEAIVESSDYITKQVNNPEQFVQNINGDGQVPWYNLDYKFSVSEDGESEFSFFTYSYMVDASNVVNTSTLKSSFNKPIARAYEYIYTGANRDILSFDIQYNFAFFQALQDLPQQRKNKTENSKGKGPSRAQQRIGKVAEVKGKTPVKSERSISDKSNPSAGTESSGEDRDQLSIIKEVLQNPAADLLNLDLEILGDPFYLQQTDFRYGDYAMNTTVPFTLNDGSIYDKMGEVYVNLSFKTPVDLDDETGLMTGLQGVGKYQTAFFSGIYRIIGVETVMSQGQFTQRLQLVRLKNQEIPQVEIEPQASIEGTDGEVQEVEVGEFGEAVDVEQGFTDDGSNKEMNKNKDNQTTDSDVERILGEDRNTTTETVVVSEGYTVNKGNSKYEGYNPNSQAGGGQGTRAAQRAGVSNFTTTETLTVQPTVTTRTTTIQERGGGSTIVETEPETKGKNKYGGLTRRQYYERNASLSRSRAESGTGYSTSPSATTTENSGTGVGVGR